MQGRVFTRGWRFRQSCGSGRITSGLMDVAALILIGAVAGILAGLLGIGGGAIIVPVLALVFVHQRLNPHVVMPAAVGTSLAAIVFSPVSSVQALQKRGALLLP